MLVFWMIPLNKSNIHIFLKPYPDSKLKDNYICIVHPFGFMYLQNDTTLTLHLYKQLFKK